MSVPETSKTALSALELLDARAIEIARSVVDAEFRSRPELEQRFGTTGRARCEKDVLYHISYLTEAIASSAPELFVEYVLWAQTLLAGRNIDVDDLITNLRYLHDGIAQQLPTSAASVANMYVDQGIAGLESSARERSVGADAPHGDIAAVYLERLLAADRQSASRLIHDAVRGGMSVRDVYLHVFQRSQYEIGRLWQVNQINVAQEHYCTAATQLIMGQLYEHVFASERVGYTMVAACVAGDLHEIGIRMISDFFEMEGWDTYYIGANTPTPDLVQLLVERRADLLAISATMTFHVRKVRALIEAVRDCEPVRDIKILVGGYPFNLAPNLWLEVGADGVARDAAVAVTIGRDLMTRQ